MEKINVIYNMDCREGLKTLPDNSVHCIVTSPPYWALRNYNVDGQIGLEESPAVFIQVMVEVFEECRRVLREDGTLWLNIGDTYYGGNTQPGGGSHIGKHLRSGTPPAKNVVHGLKPKDLVGVPWMLAFALRDAGWYLRQDIIWHKPNPMPESVGDRCTKAHEYLFLFSKSSTYYYDALAIATPYAEKTLTTFGIEFKSQLLGDGTGFIASENWNSSMKVRKPKEWKTPDGWDTGKGAHGSFHKEGREKGRRPRQGVDEKGGNQGTGNIPSKKVLENGGEGYGISGGGLHPEIPDTNEIGKANKRSVWTVPTQKFKDAHFATFPEQLIVDPIKAGCPIDGIVLDPFMGAGTTALVARKLNRNYIGFELNPEYVKMANKRLAKTLGIFQ